MTGTIQPKTMITGTISPARILNGTLCRPSGTAQSDHIITAVNPAGAVLETVPEVVTYTIDEEG